MQQGPQPGAGAPSLGALIKRYSYDSTSETHPHPPGDLTLLLLRLLTDSIRRNRRLCPPHSFSFIIFKLLSLSVCFSWAVVVVLVLVVGLIASTHVLRPSCTH